MKIKSIFLEILKINYSLISTILLITCSIGIHLSPKHMMLRKFYLSYYLLNPMLMYIQLIEQKLSKC